MGSRCVGNDMKQAVRPAVFALALVASAAFAKSWNGIEPGVSKKDDIIAKFGQPSKTVSAEGREILAYYKDRAITGTTQAQFKIDPKTEIVERIDVFPGPVIDKDAIEGTYGPMCPIGQALPNTPCFVKKITDDFRVYYLYAKLGLAIFFNEDGKTVQSFIFQPAK